MRIALAVMLFLICPLLLAGLGGYLGAYASFHLVSEPSGEHCGLWVLPALAIGCVGGLLGFGGGLLSPASEKTLAPEESLDFPPVSEGRVPFPMLDPVVAGFGLAAVFTALIAPEEDAEEVEDRFFSREQVLDDR